jgi:hypothetical protein
MKHSCFDAAILILRKPPKRKLLIFIALCTEIKQQPVVDSSENSYVEQLAVKRFSKLCRQT